MPWQIVPSQLWVGCGAKIPRAQRVPVALWQMEKLDLSELERAATADG